MSNQADMERALKYAAFEARYLGRMAMANAYQAVLDGQPFVIPPGDLKPKFERMEIK